ncbi:hypothetical protein EVAR_45881_1 [Eumeta japonica]|uniref:Uncharacterized protein n=1 Tax=Eumeta variegata TaxID=151549 RepID=A0A4C1XQ38_EUMVA|nr:hypothetical protein EVAR_45881_1 [Eumeta japonica]
MYFKGSLMRVWVEGHTGEISTGAITAARGANLGPLMRRLHLQIYGGPARPLSTKFQMDFWCWAYLLGSRCSSGGAWPSPQMA